MIPLRLRLQRAFWLALILALWAVPKIVWENQIAEEQKTLRYHNAPITFDLRAQLGQNLTIGLLSGLRAVVADAVWLLGVNDWQNNDWFRLARDVHLCNTLQPHSLVFWHEGAQYLGWDAAYGSLRLVRLEPNEFKRQRAFIYWRDQGRKVLLNGLENLPDRYELWQQLAVLNQQDKQFMAAGDCYKKASLCPNAPIYLERFAPTMYEKAGDLPAAYAAWVALWQRLTPKQKADPQHWIEKITDNINRLKNKLNETQQKRGFSK